MKDIKGFTIPEIMIGMVIMLLVMGAALTIYNMSQVSWTEGNAQIGIERDASIAMGKMIRWISGVYGIMDAKSVNTPNAAPPNIDNTVVFTGVDNVNRSFYLSNGELWYDPNTSTSGGESRMVKNVSGLEFRRGNGTTQYGSEDRLGIKLALQQMVMSKTMSVTLYTAVKVRN